MHLPFTVQQFYGVFSAYNETLWPAPVVLTALALAAIALVMVPLRWSGVAISTILGVLWAWLSVAYHWAFFAAINPLAYGFSALSMAGAVVFVWEGVVRRRMTFQIGRGAHKVAGISAIVYALLVYPAWSWFAGHRYPAVPTFGLPCPTTIFTIGMLALAATPCSRAVLVVPILWSFIGVQAAFLLGVAQDFGLGAAGMVGIMLFIRSKPGKRRIY